MASRQNFLLSVKPPLPRRFRYLRRSSHIVVNKLTESKSNNLLREKRLALLRRKGIYLLPNAFTTAALLCGFFSIVQAMNGRFEIAAMAIFASMVLDGMDGRIARMTNTQSAFGEQYDSLSDMVSFGVAPALVMYEWILSDLGRWGWLSAFVYCAGAALRLARFNINLNVIDKSFFQGLPSPAAAALMAGFVWLLVEHDMPLNPRLMAWSCFALSIYSGITMVSNAPFYSGKTLDAKYRVRFWVILLMVTLLVIVSSAPSIVLFTLFVFYGFSGYFVWLYRTLTRYCYKSRGSSSALQ